MIPWLLLGLLLPVIVLAPGLGLVILVTVPIFICLHLRMKCLGERINHPTLAFFHPYCNAGGGGERVLWQSVLALSEHFPRATLYVYTGDTDATPDTIIGNAERCFGLTLPRDKINFIYLRSRILTEARCYPVFTLLGQSLGSMVLGAEALWRFQPAYFVDSMGYAFTYLLAEWVGCDIISYVHYPTISTDMLDKVASRESTYNNRGVVARNPILSNCKLIYYRAFAALYSWMGRRSKLAFVNSSWTKGHIEELWAVPERTVLLFPPCNTTSFLQINNPTRKNRVVSVSQFRPEKNQALQLEAMKCYVERTGRRDVTLTLVGGVRNEGDRARVELLRKQAEELEITDLVEFRIGIPFTELKEILSESLVGLHTMWNEHFGIGVVEFMAAGLVALAHRSGGPAMDIVVEKTGYLAETAPEYSEQLERILGMGPEELEEMRALARDHVKREFSDEAFRDAFIANCKEHVDLDLREIELISEMEE